MTDDLKQGKVLPLMEQFYSIQGEGFNTGKAAFFIRIGGCDVSCHWCDVKESWNESLHPLTQTDIIVQNVLDHNVDNVVITGGEPLRYNLDYLSYELKKNKIKTFLETAGTCKITGIWDWICLSPKEKAHPRKDFFQNADELNVIIQNESDIQWAEINAEKVSQKCLLYLQPEWSQRNMVTPIIVEYIKKNPRWMLSLQIHKFLKIP